MYVEEYLKFIISLYRIKVENYNEIIEKTGLSDVLKKKISTLSKGFKNSKRDDLGKEQYALIIFSI